jgi:hypothetical protein
VTRPDEGGQTVIDLVVASALLLVMVPVLLTMLTVTDTSLGAVAARSNAESAARQILSGTAREIRSARPIGWCPSAPPGRQFTTPTNACLHVGDYQGRPPGAPVPGGPIIFESPDQLWFWGYSEIDRSVTASAPIGVPDCVHVYSRSDGEVFVDRWAGSGTFTNATCPGVSFPSDGSPPTTTGRPAAARFVGALSSGAPAAIFSSSDRDGGVPVTPAATVLVHIAPTFTARVGMASSAVATFTVEVEAAIRGTIYQQEQTWDATN